MTRRAIFAYPTSRGPRQKAGASSYTLTRLSLAYPTSYDALQVTTRVFKLRVDDTAGDV